jgi:hypothetical protein
MDDPVLVGIRAIGERPEQPEELQNIHPTGAQDGVG